MSQTVGVDLKEGGGTGFTQDFRFLNCNREVEVLYNDGLTAECHAELEDGDIYATLYDDVNGRVEYGVYEIRDGESQCIASAELYIDRDGIEDQHRTAIMTMHDDLVNYDPGLEQAFSDFVGQDALYTKIAQEELRNQELGIAADIDKDLRDLAELGENVQRDMMSEEMSSIAGIFGINPEELSADGEPGDHQTELDGEER